MKILLIGDSCYDYYHYGEVKRISPEAPIPILDFTHVTKKHGMASNVYDNLKSLGANVHIVTSFSENKRRYIDKKTGQQLLRVDEKINEETYEDVDAPLFSNYDAIVISDYNKGFLTYESILSIRENYDGPMFIDTKKPNLSVFRDMFIKINQYEYAKSEYLPPEKEKLIVTYGGEKVNWNNRWYYPPKVDAYDVCGAGDTFLAALAFEYLRKNDMELSIMFAMKAASITVKHVGVYAPTLREIENDKT
jgi:D-beta-D-heptose 7-phosphate kinase/D-beta-D-heptose 1-phosphate adenosyltransferase